MHFLLGRGASWGNPFVRPSPAQRENPRVRSFQRRIASATILFALTITLIVPSLGGLSWPAQAQGAADAGDFLISFGRHAAQELNDPALSDGDRERRFRELLREAVDIPTIGRFILGANWRRAGQAERADFLAAFEDVALQRFLPMFTGKSDEYSGQGFEVVALRPVSDLEDQVFVQTRVARAEGPPVDLIWRIRETGKRFQILDISVQGLSMALTLRDEYGAAIRRLGGVGELVQAMRQKLRDGAFAPKALGTAK